jgi:hypothetical protein
VNIIKGKRADDVGRGTFSRRNVLGGLAALPVLATIGSATVAVARPDAVGDLVRGAERRYNAPLLTAGTQLLMPAGITAVPIQDFYRQPHLASAESAWPYLTATDGTTDGGCAQAPVPVVLR